QEITGFDVQGSLGKPCREFLHPEDRIGGSELYRWLVESGENRGQHQVRHVTRSGNVRWLEVHCRPDCDERGRVTGVSGTLIDVTDRRMAERKLRDQLQLTQQLLDAVPAPIFYRTSDGRF